ncbi:spore coat protein U domain-containing protein [Niveispirillum lacus]|nr:spore coat protein U domain-containing protein [Niveispirillum lacus]
MSHLLRPFLAVLAILGAVSPANAVNSVPIKGTVETNCTVQVSQTSTNSIDLVRGTSRLNVARVREHCNLGNGFKISITSANAGSLMDAAGNKVPYTISYDNSGVRSLAAGVVLTRTSPALVVTTKNFTVTVPAKADAIAGSYADTITISIAAR